jgi:hypothetical protein
MVLAATSTERQQAAAGFNRLVEHVEESLVY